MSFQGGHLQYQRVSFPEEAEVNTSLTYCCSAFALQLSSVKTIPKTTNLIKITAMQQRK